LWACVGRFLTLLTFLLHFSNGTVQKQAQFHARQAGDCLSLPTKPFTGTVIGASFWQSRFPDSFTLCTVEYKMIKFKISRSEAVLYYLLFYVICNLLVRVLSIPWQLLKWMRSGLVVRASDCQCTSCNGPGFDPSIRRHSGI
jgi:hypothetical protein